MKLWEQWAQEAWAAPPNKSVSYSLHKPSWDSYRLGFLAGLKKAPEVLCAGRSYRKEREQDMKEILEREGE